MSTAKPEILETLSSPYNDVVVRRRKKRIDFDVAGATFATWHPKKMLTGYSWDAITTACMMMAEEPRSILLLGLAGGTVVRQLRALLPDTCISAVEIDEAVVDLGRRHMELDQLQCNVIIDDAYEYLRTTDRSFDIVVDDVYRSGVDDVERPYQKIHDLVARMSRRIHRNGLVIANFVTGDDHQRLYEQAEAVFLSRFEACAKVIPPLGYNTILVGGTTFQQSKSVRNFRTQFAEKLDRKHWSKVFIERLS